MRVRGTLTCLAVAAALSILGPSAQAASKPRPTPTSTLKTLKAHQTCTKTAVQGAKLCLRVELKQQATRKKTTTWVTMASYETRLVRKASITFAARTPEGKDVVVYACKAGVGACASMFFNPEKYTQISARLLDKSQKVLLQTSVIHLPLR
jgi:hypothetical protein